MQFETVVRCIVFLFGVAFGMLVIQMIHERKQQLAGNTSPHNNHGRGGRLFDRSPDRLMLTQPDATQPGGRRTHLLHVQPHRSPVSADKTPADEWIVTEFRDRDDGQTEASSYTAK